MKLKFSAAAVFMFLALGSQLGCAEPYRPLDHLWDGTRDLPNLENRLIFGIGSVATLGAYLLADQDLKNWFGKRSRMCCVDIGNDWLGTGLFGSVVGAGTLIYGLATNRAHEINSGESHLEGLVATFAYPFGLKYAIRRQRPNGSSLAFPSGHTSTLFSSAANLMDFYGPWVGVPALTIGAYTAACRLAINAHYLSDVIFGAVLGYATGHAYTLHHQSGSQEKKQTLSVYPFFENRKDFGLMAKIEI